MPNFEIADHPVYHGLELQWFDDAAHGTGMLAFLGRRDSHVFDYYARKACGSTPPATRSERAPAPGSRRTSRDALLR